jgi:hypothetical protein
VTVSSYITLPELRDWIRLSDNVTSKDPTLSTLIDVASGMVDAYCGRTFTATTADATAEARIFQSDRVDDFSTLDDLAVRTSIDRTNWTTRTIDTDFWVGPDPTSALADAYWQINPLQYVTWCGTFIEVTAKWGWPAVPEAVKTATKLHAHWLSKRPGDPYGIVALGDLPSRVSQTGDPDARRLLAPYRRLDRVGGIA